MYVYGRVSPVSCRGEEDAREYCTVCSTVRPDLTPGRRFRVPSCPVPKLSRIGRSNNALLAVVVIVTVEG